jgi:hypothetical protein
MNYVAIQLRNPQKSAFSPVRTPRIFDDPVFRVISHYNHGMPVPFALVASVECPRRVFKPSFNCTHYDRDRSTL